MVGASIVHGGSYDEEKLYSFSFTQIELINLKLWKFHVVILNFRLSHVVDKPVLNPCGDLDFLVFPCGTQREIFFVDFRLFLPNAMTFFHKINNVITLIDHIFRKLVDIST